MIYKCLLKHTLISVTKLVIRINTRVRVEIYIFYTYFSLLSDLALPTTILATKCRHSTTQLSIILFKYLNIWCFAEACEKSISDTDAAGVHKY